MESEPSVQAGQGPRRIRPMTSEIAATMRNTKNRIFAISVAPARPR